MHGAREYRFIRPNVLNVVDERTALESTQGPGRDAYGQRRVPDVDDVRARDRGRCYGRREHERPVVDEPADKRAAVIRDLEDAEHRNTADRLPLV